jgi:xanthine/CO dehydrogenase XdhC/CoxF family maturation factor
VAESDLLAEATRRLEAGEEVVLATAVRIQGAPPCQPGQKLLLGRGGPLAGTLGCAEFDAQAAASAPDLLAGGQPALAIYEHDLGSVEVYLEPMRPRAQLVVLGATPVAEYLLRGGRDLGYRTVLVEDREERITAEHRAAADAVAPTLDGISLAPGTDAVHTDKIGRASCRERVSDIV